MNEIAICHLLGGQVVIGEVSRIDEHVIISQPHEVFAVPAESSLQAVISLVPFGSIMGCVPSISLNEVRVHHTLVLATITEVDERLKDAWTKAATRSPVETASINRVLRDSKTDITKGGTL